MKKESKEMLDDLMQSAIKDLTEAHSKAVNDAAIYGVGFLKVGAEGQIEYTSIREVMDAIKLILGQTSNVKN